MTHDSNNKTKNLITTAGFLIAATLLAKIFGMLRDSFVGAYFGTGGAADAFFAATQIPLMFFDMVIGGVISSAFIPVFNEKLQKEGKENAMRYGSKFINAVLIITGLICIVGIFFSSAVIEIITPGLDAETKALAIKLARIMFPMIIFTGLAFSFVGILQSFEHYKIPAVISLVSNAALILYLAVFKNRFGVEGLAAAMLVGWSLQAIVQLPSLVSIRFKYTPDFNFNDDGIKKTFLLALPLLVCTWVQPIGNLINMHFASALSEGSMSSLQYANRLYVIIVGVFSFVVTNLVFPKLSRASAADNTGEKRALVQGSLKSVSFVMFPLMLGLVILAKPIVSIIYERGEFNALSVHMTSTALTFYALGMVGYSVAEVLNKSYFAMQDTKTPTVSAVISIAVNIALSALLVSKYEIAGLALSCAAASTVNAVLNFLFIRKKIPGLFEKKDFANIIKILVSSLVMAATVYFSYKNFLYERFYTTFVSKLCMTALLSFLGAAVYFICCSLLKVSETRIVYDIFKRGDKNEK